MAKKILIIDDEETIRESVAGILSDEGFTPLPAASAREAFALLETQAVHVVLLDIWMPEMDGMAALPKIKELYPDLPVIMISGHGNIETAVQATKMGAFDFIEKPPSYDKIILAINNALHFSRLARENEILRGKQGHQSELTGISPAINAVRDQILRVAPTQAWVLIRGEHGTGKELAAQMIHGHSSAKDKPMIEVNCAAIPEELIESELFGHEKGAFTGATTSKRGKFDLADGSILFLDEIGDMSLKTQAKVLRILQEQKFERVGGAKTISVDVRVIAATNKDLEAEIEAGNFRADLFYRLNVVPITLPPLRERLEDLPLLVEDLMKGFQRKGFGRKKFLPGALHAMQRHHWPGNVRELRNFLERLSIMSPAAEVSGEQVSQILGGEMVRSRPEQGGSQALSGPGGEAALAAAMTFKDAKKQFEADFLKAKIAENEGNISKTAEQIGVERSHLHKRIKALGLD
ncbi:MAG: sigma-54 dependent transcriptional regulator [Desulfurivibrionaceae bacterium]|nr:sigma-54 dependent transcriptional regulator [Desulfurivibrionaceae bacterium]